MPPQQNYVYLPVDAEVLPDNPQWTNRFRFTSNSGSRYTIAQSVPHRYWGCSCTGWKMRRRCRHLEEFSLPASAAPYEAVLVEGALAPAAVAGRLSPASVIPKERATKPHIITPPKPVNMPKPGRRQFSLDEDV